jgi:hypothetical protein
MVTLPDAPLLVVPVWKVIVPLTPAAPALPERRTTAPELFEVPTPLEIETKPPVCGVLAPAVIRTSPPTSDELVPTDTLKLPLLPPAAAAAPVVSRIDPDAPSLEAPVANDM